MRIGQGYDSHRFTEGDCVPIGGVSIPHDRGILAHSDGDVLLHALTDALLGALALGDIGQLYPDNDPQYANMSSDKIVQHIMSLVVSTGYHVVNIDATVIAERPKLSSYITVIRERISQLVAQPISSVSVKATTNEQMGWIGKREGLAAQVVVLLAKNNPG